MEQPISMSIYDESLEAPRVLIETAFAAKDATISELEDSVGVLQDTLTTTEAERDAAVAERDTLQAWIDNHMATEHNQPPPPPNPPAGLTADPGDKKVDLSWEAVTGCTYRIHQAPQASGPWTLAADNVTNTNHAVVGLTNDTTYHFAVTAVRTTDSVESAKSDVVSATPEAPDEPPPPSGDLWYGTTVFGQSYARYKLQTISSQSARYAAVERDTRHDGKMGSGVMRVFGGPGGPSYSGMRPSYIRDGQPVIYSFNFANNQSESSCKSEFRSFLRSGPNVWERVWLAHHHEPDNDWPGSLNRTWWLDSQVWIREVLDEPEFAQRRTQIRFGWIGTGVPFGGASTTSDRHWKRIVDDLTARANGRKDIWDYDGMDRYNPAWDGSTRYMPWSNWAEDMIKCHAYTGRPFVVGEAGSPRDDTGQTVAARDADRAAWLDEQYRRLRDLGWVDAVAYWRVPSNSNPLNAWSTNMITPAGYDDAIRPQVCQNGGFDAPGVVDVHSRYCIQSMQAARPQIPFYT